MSDDLRVKFITKDSKDNKNQGQKEEAISPKLDIDLQKCPLCSFDLDEDHSQREVRIPVLSDGTETTIRCVDCINTINANTKNKILFRPIDYGPLNVFENSKQTIDSFRSGHYQKEKVAFFAIFTRVFDKTPPQVPSISTFNPSSSAVGIGTKDEKCPGSGSYWVRNPTSADFTESFRQTYAVSHKFQPELNEKCVIFCPRGIIFYSGITGPQKGFRFTDLLYSGGGENQIYIPQPLANTLLRLTRQFLIQNQGRFSFQDAPRFETLCRKEKVYALQNQYLRQYRKHLKELKEAQVKLDQIENLMKDAESKYSDIPVKETFLKYDSIAQLVLESKSLGPSLIPVIDHIQKRMGELMMILDDKNAKWRNFCSQKRTKKLISKEGNQLSTLTENQKKAIQGKDPAGNKRDPTCEGTFLVHKMKIDGKIRTLVVTITYIGSRFIQETNTIINTFNVEEEWLA